MRKTLERLMEDPSIRKETMQAIDAIGNSEYSGLSEECLDKCRKVFSTEFKVKPQQRSVESVFDCDLWQALLEDAQDAEIDVPNWLRHGCPSGTEKSPIHGRGIFPTAAGPTAAVEQSRTYAAMAEGKVWKQADHKNYKSFYTDEGSHALEEVARISKKKFIKNFANWDQVLATWPDAKVSKVALILKTKPDGSIKRRFVIDLLRSGENGEATITERIVLPRLQDFAAGILDLFEYNSAEQNLEADGSVTLLTIDFTDAFYTLHLDPAARGRLAFRTLAGWAVFVRLCFGMAGAPLVWGRVASAGCRLAQAIFCPTELRIQCYVDDPAIAARGSLETRRHLLAILILFWSVLGLQMSYGKGTMGSSVHGSEQRSALFRERTALDNLGLGSSSAYRRTSSTNYGRTWRRSTRPKGPPSCSWSAAECSVG